MRSCFLAVLCLALFSGCGGPDEKSVAETVPVKGKVTYKGQPLTTGLVQFEPDFGRNAYGSIKPDGTYSLKTYKDDDGAAKGLHRVYVTGTGKGGKELVLKKYTQANTSGIEIEVSPDKTDYPIDIK